MRNCAKIKAIAHTVSQIAMSTPNPNTRLEAFSDGVFAIAITVLVFNLQVPQNLATDQTLWGALVSQWPIFAAYLVAFSIIGIMWINHHNLLTLIQHSDHLLLVFNTLFLLGISFFPFPTRLLAEYLLTAQSQTAGVIFAAMGLLMAALFSLLWYYAAHKRRLVGANISDAVINRIHQNYRFGFVLYSFALFVAFFSPLLMLTIHLGLAIYFALPLQVNLIDGE
jgi:uncharacterized membrane protein